MNVTWFTKITVLSTFVFSFISFAYSQQLAFPSAEGWGKYTVGGRGGYVYEVTNLNDDGPGSLREALGSKGPRTIVFRVGGTIMLKSAVKIDDFTTVAGQTAPGDGICIGGWPVNLGRKQIILRYIRVRLGDGTGYHDDAIHSSTGSSDYIFDHVSASWSVDETFSIYNCTSVTMQWCMIAESLNNSIHWKGDHGYGGLWGGIKNTYHHNLLAHHSSRNPRFKNNADFRNNVVYNWAINSSYGGTGKNEFNMVANYYKAGPATPEGEMRSRIVEPYNGKWYITDNFVYGYPEITANNWGGGVQGGSGERSDKPFEHEPIKQQTALDAYESVMQSVGCSFPKRDAVDTRIIQDVREGKAAAGKNGHIDSQNDVGGWPTLNSGTAPTDSDHDGMPDEWETRRGLNPNNAEDRNGKGAGGYTNLEVYLNSIVSGGTVFTAPKHTIVPHGIHLAQMNGHKINYSLPKKSVVTLEVFSVTGEKIAILVNENKEDGNYTIDYSGLLLSNGQYICKLTTESGTISRNMYLLQ